MTKFNFKNTGAEEFNDVIYPGYPFHLENYSYRFTILPKTLFWRFGLRFSKNEKINFVKSGNRHVQNDEQEYKDIHISVGDKQNGRWLNPTSFHLAQYNIPNQEHLLKSSSSYQPSSKVDFGFQYLKEEGTLLINYGDNNSYHPGFPVLLDPAYKYFKLFAWADGIDFELDCSIEVILLNKSALPENELDPFKVGNVTFRMGDMFDYYTKSRSNIILLPASSYGTVTDSIFDKIPFLEIPKPEVANAGTIALFKPSPSSNFIRAGYAYSVQETTSSEELINTICRNIYNAISEIPSTEREKIVINLPLLGTGAGGIDPVNIAVIYDNCFNENHDELKFLVSVQKAEVFMSIRNRMLGKLIRLNDETFYKPDEVLELEKLLSIDMDFPDFRTDKNGHVISLTLNDISVDDFSILKEFADLKSLALHECNIINFSFLTKLKNLSSLTLFSCKIKDFDSLGKLKNLLSLRVNSCVIHSFEFIPSLRKLENLSLIDCDISDINFLSHTINLRYLDLSRNELTNINQLADLEKLKRLTLSYNKINDIEPLTKLQELTHLEISYNHINSITPISQMANLKNLKIGANPYFNRKRIVLNEIDNQLTSVKNIISRELNEKKYPVVLPAKVLLLGNHASGKSSLLNYIQNIENIPTASTHIIRIQRYFKNLSTGQNNIPDAIFFDFGGQDYYHGIYRAFLSTGSAYLILWNERSNENVQRQDSNDVRTQDFSVSYWLWQKKYIEEEINRGIEKDPVLLIQTHADEDRRQSFDNSDNDHNFENEFYVSLEPLFFNENEVYNLALKYLKASIDVLIQKKQKRSDEPQWYIDFLILILKGSSDYKSKSLQNDILPLYNRNEDNKTSYLKDDLIQFHKQGLILYYDHEELGDFVWLNPVALVEHIHNSILTAEIKKKSDGRATLEQFKDVDPVILKMLCIQKVVFRHEYGPNNEPEYIIPNFLPLISEDSYFPLLTFDFQKPFFTLKFKHFLPFGLINQIICFFGRLEDQKKFWRDTLLFTFDNKARILIHLDFQYLEIKVYCSFLDNVKEIERTEITTYLFYSIMALYWDSHKPLAFNDFTRFYKNKLRIDDSISDEQRPIFEACIDIYSKKECRPSDLYISVNNKDFVSYTDICSEESSIMINVKALNETRELIDTSKVTYIYPFKWFTNRALQKQQKVVISYSKRDLKLVHKFQNYLAPLLQSGLIEEPWYCTELIGGREWNKEIERKFDEADIIFFMISDNLMSTKYVLENEIKNAIDRWDRDKSVRIVPILLVPYDFNRSEPYNLGRFTGFPYMLRPVTLFKNQNSAWHAISESIKIMITKDLFPDRENEALSNELKTIFENIGEEKWN